MKFLFRIVGAAVAAMFASDLNLVSLASDCPVETANSDHDFGAALLVVLVAGAVVAVELLLVLVVLGALLAVAGGALEIAF